MRRWPSFDDCLRGLLSLSTILAVGYLAVVVRDEAASGALIGLLGLAGSWLFRGKVERQQ